MVSICFRDFFRKNTLDCTLVDTYTSGNKFKEDNMSKTEKKERTHLDVPMTKQDKETINRAAKRIGLTMAAFVRMATLKAAREQD
jgi:AraC-like DNA-binding protein